MLIIEKVRRSHDVIVKLERSKIEDVEKAKAKKYRKIGGIEIAMHPDTIAALAKATADEYDKLIATKKADIENEIDLAEKVAKKMYYDAYPMGSNYMGEIEHIVHNYENSLRHPSPRDSEFWAEGHPGLHDREHASLRDSEFLAKIKEHTELGDKWALIYVLAGLDIFPENEEILGCLEKLAPDLALAKMRLYEVDIARKLNEVFNIVYYSGTDFESVVAAKNRLAALGANPNYTGMAGEGISMADIVYEAFCESIGISFIGSKVVELSGEIGNDYAKAQQVAKIIVDKAADNI